MFDINDVYTRLNGDSVLGFLNKMYITITQPTAFKFYFMSYLRIEKNVIKY